MFWLHLNLKVMSEVVAVLLLAMAGLEQLQAIPSFQQIGNVLIMSNGNVRLEYHLNAGTTDFFWKNSRKISGFYSGISLNTGYLKGISYSSWNYVVSSSNQVIVAATGNPLRTALLILALLELPALRTRRK